MEGFVKGPIEGGYGVIKGTASLVQHTISGVFISSQSFSDGIASISYNFTDVSFFIIF
jgi:vacuolar protein sorting-associated protein 13A/C